ncbi:hypothetical protein MMC25_008240 [Agyrium rufum]|nr:hypothetical protein [Agyrium rufum]
MARSQIRRSPRPSTSNGPAFGQALAIRTRSTPTSTPSASPIRVMSSNPTRISKEKADKPMPKIRFYLTRFEDIEFVEKQCGDAKVVETHGSIQKLYLTRPNPDVHGTSLAVEWQGLTVYQKKYERRETEVLERALVGYTSMASDAPVKTETHDDQDEEAFKVDEQKLRNLKIILHLCPDPPSA